MASNKPDLISCYLSIVISFGLGSGRLLTNLTVLRAKIEHDIQNIILDIFRRQSTTSQSEFVPVLKEAERHLFEI